MSSQFCSFEATKDCDNTIWVYPIRHFSVQCPLLQQKGGHTAVHKFLLLGQVLRLEGQKVSKEVAKVQAMASADNRLFTATVRPLCELLHPPIAIASQPFCACIVGGIEWDLTPKSFCDAVVWPFMLVQQRDAVHVEGHLLQTAEHKEVLLKK